MKQLPRSKLKKYIIKVCLIPADFVDTVNNVVTPRVVLPGTESTSIQNDTQEMTTMRIVGTYDWTMWKPMDLGR